MAAPIMVTNLPSGGHCNGLSDPNYDGAANQFRLVPGRRPCVWQAGLTS